MRTRRSVDAVATLKKRQPSEVILWNFSENLRRLRRAQGYTQHALSAVCGFPPSYIGDVEKMNVNITLGNLKALCNGLRCAPNDLLLKPPPETAK
jgi:transcriptional regulator with XRE-family HTH domain